MAPLFSKADLNEFWHDVQNEVALICAKCGKDLFSISKVIGRKTKWPRFFGLPCRVFWIFLPNIIKVDPYNFELYRFKVGSFFETRCMCMLYL